MKVKAASQKVNLGPTAKLCSLWFSVFATLDMLIITIKGRNVWHISTCHGHTYCRYLLNRRCIAQVWGSTFSQKREGEREPSLQIRSQKPARRLSCWLGREGLETSVHGSSSLWTVP